jgi:hypothetical protein
MGGGPPMGGYPPGGYGPPGMAPMPPPPPQKKGMSGAMIALIVIVVILVLGGGGCATCLCIGARSAKKELDKFTSEPIKPLPVVKPTAPAENNNWITAERPYVKFLVPPGWTTKITDNKEWGIFRSPKNDAVLTFTTFNRPGESTVRLGKAASVLGVTDINWGAARVGTVGKDRFDAHVGDGSCNFEGPGAYTWYATVNTGTADQILLIFSVAANAPKARRAEAHSIIDSLQRR